MKALVVLVVAVAAVVALATADPTCCFPPAFMTSYEHFSNGTGFLSRVYYSEQYGLRFDGQLWDPTALSSRFHMYLLKEGHFYTYNVTTNRCTHFHCEDCFQPFCAGKSQGYKYTGNVSIGTQEAQKYAFSLGLTYYSEITVMNYRPGLCVPINELAISGMAFETETQYANAFFYNLVPTTTLSKLIFQPPSVCHPDRVVSMDLKSAELSLRSLPTSILSPAALQKFARM